MKAKFHNYYEDVHTRSYFEHLKSHPQIAYTNIYVGVQRLTLSISLSAANISIPYILIALELVGLLLNLITLVRVSARAGAKNQRIFVL